MYRSIIALSLATVVTSAVPALAGPNGGSFFPLQTPRRDVPRETAPHALLGDTAAGTDSVRALRPGVTGKTPTRSWQRRPSEGK
jgi:hypothetical protein